MIVKRLQTGAFSLVEVTLALGVGAFCLITVAALLPIGVQTNQRSTSQTDATAILSNVIADMRATASTSATTQQYNITFGTAKTLFFSHEGQPVASTNSRYRLDITFPANPAGTKASTFAYLRLTWPVPPNPPTGTPDPNTISGSSEAFAAFNRN
jgi:uncharacterized protein (TIGR02598 family)